MKLVAWLKSKLRLVAADTIALFICHGLTFFLPPMWELLLAGTSFKQSVGMRGFSLVNTVLRNLLFGGLVGQLSDWLERVTPKAKTNAFMGAVANGLAVWLYQLPMYLVGAQLMGFTGKQMLLVQVPLFLESPLVGLLFKKIKELMRKFFHAR